MTTVIAFWYGATRTDDDRHRRRQRPTEGAAMSATRQSNLEAQRPLPADATPEIGLAAALQLARDDPDAVASFGRPRVALRGRGREQEQLGQLVTGIRSGRCGVLVVRGE